MAKYDDMMPPCMDDEDSDDEVGPSGCAAHKGKPRRKSHQRPQGSDQIRQAFSKRKKGLVLKAYQLSALTDAKVFMFIVNDKGTSWAYATPGYSTSLNSELLKELRALAQVPEQAKLVTEVMPDPPVAKAADAMGGSEQAFLRRADQVHGCSFPCTRAATGSLPSRSRSSYSGGSAGDAPSSEVAQLARAGSTTTMRTLQSAKEEQSPSKQHARPLSGSSFACGRAGTATAHGQTLLHQRPVGKFGASMEPPTPCGVYNLLGQPTPAAIESPTVISDMAASSASSISRQQLNQLELAAGMRVAASPNAAGHPCDQLPLQQVHQQPAHQQRRHWEQPSPAQWAAPGQQQLELDGWGLHQHSYGAATCQDDGWAAVEVAAAPYVGARQCATLAGCTSSAQQQEFMSVDGALTHMASGGAPYHVKNSMEGWQKQQADVGAAPIDSSSRGAFESMQRGLAPLRVSRPILHADADGARSAPVTSVSNEGQQAQWVSSSLREFPFHAAIATVPASHAAGNNSSYQHSPSSMQQMQSSSGGFADDKARASAMGGTVAGTTAAALIGRQDPCSAGESPTAALSQQMLSVLAVESPMHSPMHMSHEHYQQSMSGQAHEAYLQQQQQQQLEQQHDQGAYIPRTDDLVSDPLMDILMDQALGGGLSGRVPSSQQHHQHQQRRLNPQISIMEATLQHGAVLAQQQQHYEQVQKQCSQQQQRVATCTGHYPDVCAGTGMDSQPRYSSNYLKMMDMLKHMPLVSDPSRKAWEDQVRQLKATLAPHESEEFSAYVRALWHCREQGAGSRGPAATPASGVAVINVSGARASGPGVGGKHRHGPSRLSTTASPCMDAKPVDTAAACGMAAGMPASSVPISQALLMGDPVGAAAHSGYAAQVAVPDLDAAVTVAAAALESVTAGFHGPHGACHMLPVLHTAAGTAPLPIPGDQGVSTAAARHVVSTVGPERTASAPLPATVGGLSDLLARTVQCSSPLKRGQSSFCGPSSGVLDAGFQRAMSPLKRTCRDLSDAAGFAAPSQAVPLDGGGGAGAAAAESTSHRAAEGCSSNSSCGHMGSMTVHESSPILPELLQNPGADAATKPSAGLGSEGVAAGNHSTLAAG